MRRKRRNIRPKNLQHPRETLSRISTPEDVNSVDYENWQERLERAYEPEEEQPRALPLVRHRARSMAPADEYERTRRPFSYGGLVRLVAVLIILAGVVGMASWHWSAITEFYQFINQTGWTPQTQVSRKTPSAQSKFSGRIPQEQGTGQVSRGADAGCANGVGRRAAGCAPRGGRERPAGQTLRGLRHLAHGNSFAGRSD